MEIIIFFVVPMFGVLRLFNLFTFLENLHNGKNTRNQKVLGVFWTFAFIVTFYMGLISFH